jgi:6-pyruvoyltetrahydropterin/6-carboxytetrahydropterin synthase
MYRITRQFDFCYGHRLLNYEGKCRHLHGHNGLVEIALEGERLDERGMLRDFGDIKSTVQRWVDENLDHRMLLRRDDPAAEPLLKLDEPLVLLDVNPTAENIARLIYEQSLVDDLPVVEVRLWETPKCHASYCPAASGRAGNGY